MNELSEADFVRDIVYAPQDDASAFESVKVFFKVGPQRLIITIDSDSAVAQPDLENISGMISSMILKKMRVDIFNDCDVYYSERGRFYRVRYANIDGKISKLIESIRGEES